jgi:hypothetical protein
LGLVSIGEDAFCQIWQIGRKGLMQLVNDRYHSGKHIWAVAEGHLRGHQVITGGADGAIMSRSVSARPSSGDIDASTAAQPLPKVAGSRFDHYQSSFIPLFSELGIDPATKRGSEVKSPSIKQYVFVSFPRNTQRGIGARILRGTDILHHSLPNHFNEAPVYQR